MQRYRPDIDGLRALAILPVVLFHARIPGFPGGYVGVDVFFVISGFLIAGIIADDIDRDRFSIIRFYERRARRILPALFTIVAVSFAIAWLIALPEPFAEFSRSAAATAVFASNFYFWETTNYFSVAAEYRPLLHTWSLAIEEQFYIFFPWFLVVVLRWHRSQLGIAIACVFAISLIGSIYGSRTSPVAAFYLLPSRAWELLCGAALALNLVPAISGAVLRQIAATSGLGMVLLAVFLFDAETQFPGFAALLPCLGTALIIHAGSDAQTWVSRALSAKALVFLGLISYSLYLWHWPILAFLRQGYGTVHLPLSIASAAISLSVVLAIVSWRYVERPFRTPGQIRRTGILAFAGSGTVAVVAVGLTVHAFNGMPWRIDATTRTIAAAAADRQQIRQSCMSKLPSDGLCIIGRAGVRPSVLLWGDSHAGALMPALDVALDASGLAGYVASHSACAPLLGVRRTDSYDPWSCVRFNEALVEFVDAQAAELDSVILAGRWALNVSGNRATGESGTTPKLASLDGDDDTEQDNATLFGRGLEALVNHLRSRSLRVIILGGVPEIGWDVPSLLASRLHLGLPLPDAPTLEDTTKRNELANTLLENIASKQGIELIPLAPLLCRPDCLILESNQALYSDDDHLSIYGGRNVLGPLLTGKIWPVSENVGAKRN
jgi:peptidoglycan/LPS O-acetylase OafA/YrhL